VLFRDGVAIAALEGGVLRRLAVSELDDETLRARFWRRSSVELNLYPPSEATRERWRARKRRMGLAEVDPAEAS
jgi:hypothetical protein